MFRTLSLVTGLVSVMAVGFASVSANAGLVGASPACTNGGALASMSPAAVDCIGAFAGNDETQKAEVLAAMDMAFASYVGQGNWSFLEKVDANETGIFIDTVPDTSTGIIKFASPLTEYVALSLKASNAFSIYLFDGTVSPISSVAFTTAGIGLSKTGNPKDLSHASLYQFEQVPPQPEAVPVPPGLVLLASTFALAGWMRQRCRRGLINTPLKKF